ncbi:MAG: lactate racemase domain-containing protein [Candidatus Thorarchaeota archaeon]
MRIDLHYGEGLLPLEISSSTEHVVPQTVDVHPNTAAELLRVLETPADSAPLSEIVSRANSISIVVNQIEHPELARNLLHFLLNSVETFSFNPDDITIIYPIDPDQRISSNEIDEMLGSPESRGHSLVLHNPNSNEMLNLVGETPSNSTPVFVNERFLCTDVKIGLGQIRPDVFAGATGGRMSVLPYASGIRTITRNTRLRTTHNFGPFNLTTPSCIDMIEASKLGGLDFIVNYVSDWLGNVAHICAGNPYSSWESGVDSAKMLANAEFTRRADIAIVSAGGYPSDLTLYDAIDSLHTAFEVTENGGAIVLIAECNKGVGPKGFIRGVSEFSSENDVTLAAEIGFELGFEKAQFFWNVLSSRKLVICSRLRHSLVEERLRSEAVRDPQEGLEVAQTMLASKRKIAVIPHGIRTVPHFKNH